MQRQVSILFFLTLNGTSIGHALKRTEATASTLRVARGESDVSVSLIGLHSRLSKAMPSVHFIYTTGCNDYQLIHSVVLDQSWQASGNRGKLTRITAGCKTAKDKELLSRSPLKNSEDFAVFHAEGDLDIIPSTGESYKARSRPHSIKQWMEASKPTEGVIAIVDPDFVFLKAISDHPRLLQVKPGQMVSSAGWEGFGDGSNHGIPKEYATGPVWLLKPDDLRILFQDWAELTDSWPKKTDGLMREQFAFQEAAHRAKIPAIFDESLSAVQIQRTSEAYSMHYFQSYNYGSWGVHKALASSGWYADRFNNSVPTPLSCGAPLLQEPPSPPPEERSTMPLSIYTLIPRMNQGFRAYRENYCQGEKETFHSKGAAAFGLARTMHPTSCPGLQPGELTRYLVKTDELASWHDEQALGGKHCSAEALMISTPSVSLLEVK